MENDGRHLPNNLEYFRRQHRLSQMDIATIMDISCRSSISKWERGSQYPTMIDLLKLCALYQVTPRDLYPEHTEVLQATLAQRKQAFFTNN